MRQGVAKPKNPFNCRFDKQNIFDLYGMRMIYLNVCPSDSAQDSSRGLASQRASLAFLGVPTRQLILI